MTQAAESIGISAMHGAVLALPCAHHAKITNLGFQTDGFHRLGSPKLLPLPSMTGAEQGCP